MWKESCIAFGDNGPSGLAEWISKCQLKIVAELRNVGKVVPNPLGVPDHPIKIQLSRVLGIVDRNEDFFLLVSRRVCSSLACLEKTYQAKNLVPWIRTIEMPTHKNQIL